MCINTSKNITNIVLFFLDSTNVVSFIDNSLDNNFYRNITKVHNNLEVIKMIRPVVNLANYSFVSVAVYKNSVFLYIHFSILSIRASTDWS